MQANNWIEKSSPVQITGFHLVTLCKVNKVLNTPKKVMRKTEDKACPIKTKHGVWTCSPLHVTPFTGCCVMPCGKAGSLRAAKTRSCPPGAADLGVLHREGAFQ